MAQFTSQGYRIAYEIYGEGRPILLIHGFASNGNVNWVETGWVDTLNAAGYQAITIDNRGHGKSEKIYESDAYDSREMAKDAANLIAHLELDRPAVMGYSMGARISTFLAIDAPDKVGALIIGGMGIRLITGGRDSQAIVDALLAPSLDHVTGATGKQFRRFAEHTGSDLEALAACMAQRGSKASKDELGALSMPVLVAVGTNDEVAGSAQELADLIPNAEVLDIVGRDHMRATGDAIYKSGVVGFLQREYPA